MLDVKELMDDERLKRLVPMKLRDLVRSEQHDHTPGNPIGSTIACSQRVDEIDRHRWNKVWERPAKLFHGGCKRLRKFALDLVVRGSDRWEIGQRLFGPRIES